MLHIVERSYVPGTKMSRHVHALPSMSLVIAGALRERRGASEEIARPLSISLMPADSAHDDEFSPDGARLLQVHFDDAATGDLTSEGPAFGRWRWIHSGGPGVRTFVRLLAAVRARESDAVAEQLVVDTMAAAIATDTPAPAGEPPRWLVRARELIDDSPRWPGVAELAAAAGVHRVHLARQFRRYYGCAVSDYIRRRGVQRAAQQMVRAPSTLSAVACDAGFCDQPHLCRAFRAHTGVAPSVFRALSR